MSDEINYVTTLKDEVSSLMKAGRLLDAIKLMKGQMPIVGKDWELSWNLGWSYFSLDRFDEAQKHLIKADKLTQHFLCKWALGYVYLKKELYEKAESNFSEALRMKEDYSIRIALALTYMKQGKLDEAEKIHLESIRLKPKEIRRHEAYADFLFDTGRRKEAQEFYQKANKLKREN